MTYSPTSNHEGKQKGKKHRGLSLTTTPPQARVPATVMGKEQGRAWPESETDSAFPLSFTYCVTLCKSISSLGLSFSNCKIMVVQGLGYLVAKALGDHTVLRSS